ncbi:MAG TPA: site-2 protease family protein [Deltaproteobacteria bacterium]|nr:site-2 protease family protein [Deltaproteobacteria bacterium]
MYSTLQQLSIMVVPILAAVTFHEVAHGWVADRLGDPTPRLAGRLTLNPIKHLDPIGTLVFFVTRMIGWARPVPINPLNFRDPRRGMMWVALAGPAANVVLAMGCGVLYRTLTSLPVSAASPFANVLIPLVLMLHIGVVVNLGLALFNLIPVPPLDGGRILAGLLPRERAEVLSRIEPYGFLILLLLIFGGVVRIFLYPAIELGVKLLIGKTL